MMKLLSLKLKNFKGIRDFALDAQGEDVSVYGDNATGKTTLMDSFLWLLFGKDSQDKKDFDIKTLDQDGNALPGLDHEVEGVLDLEGQTLTLKKIYKEVWTKKRGSATATFTGHTTDHFIDGVPVKKKEYEDKIAEIADESIFKLLTNPRFFNDQMHWQDRRKLLLEICGDVSDQEVIASDKALKALPEILGDRSMDKHRDYIRAQLTRINKELQQIPIRIDEATRALPELPKSGKAAYENELNILNSLKRDTEARRLRLESGGEIAEKQKALCELEAELLDMQNELRAGIMEQAKAERVSMERTRQQMDNLSATIRTKQNILRDNQAEIERLEDRMAQLRGDWDREDKKAFSFEQDDTCPTCGQALPAEQLEAAREKALADFNQAKARKLEGITRQGKDDRARAGELALQNAGLEKEIQAAEEQLKELQQEEAKIRERLDELNAKAEDTVNDPAYVEKATGKQILMDAIEALKAGNREAIAEIDAEIVELNTRLEAARLSLSAYEAHVKGEARIKELEAQERELAAEYECLEGELYLTEQFVRAKVRLLEDKINAHFEHARFKLFNVLVNGGVEECCETTYQGVPWGTGLNNGAQINVGIDIINTLSEHYGFSAPIFADNAESVTEIIPTDAQLIRLVVSAGDKKLRVEVDK